MILAPPVGAPADAGPELRVFQGVGRPVIAFDPDNGPVIDINFEQAAPATVVGWAARTDDPLT